jgi:DDE family transposase
VPGVTREKLLVHDSWCCSVLNWAYGDIVWDMFLREVKRTNRDGSRVSYLQLVHNEWDPRARSSRTKILYSFGRADEVDTAAIKRLIASFSRLLDPASAFAATAGADLAFLGSRPFGGTHVLESLWRRLGIDKTMSALVKGSRITSPAERIIFALVANRALAPSSKLAAAEWISSDVHITGLPETSDDACYRAMDWLFRIRSELEKKVYDQVADLLNLEVDLLFFDTTSTYFEVEEADEPILRNWRGEAVTGTREADENKTTGFRANGKSKDSRDDLPQIVIGMAVTREGIPVRVWSWPGNTGDQGLIRQVKADMRDWSLGRVVWVTDRGFSSGENRRYLQRGAGNYIIGEKLRSDSPEIKAALSRQGRYQMVAGNMHVKEVRIEDAGDRFVICYNPEAAARDAHTRDELAARLGDMIEGSDKLSVTRRAELRGKISTMPGLNRFLRVTPGGLLRIDKTRIKAEANLDGKFLLRSSDPKLSAEDIALGYKQLLEVERGWRDMKQIIDLRPVYHRREERIRAHVILCWLALLLIRIAENATGETWPVMRRDLDRLHAITFSGPAGTFRQLTELTKPQTNLYAQLGITQPKKIIQIAPADY